MKTEELKQNNKTFKLGDKVKVLTKVTKVDEITRKTYDWWKVIHRGIVLGINSHFVKVWDRDSEYDFILTCEAFAIDSKMIKVVRE